MDRFYFFDTQILINIEAAIAPDIASELDTLFDGDPDKVFTEMQPPGAAEEGIVRQLCASFGRFMKLTRRYLPWKM